MSQSLLELTTEEAVCAFNIASRIIYFETHSDAASYTVHRYESNHISKTEDYIMNHDTGLTNAGILPKNIQAKYLIAPTKSSWEFKTNNSAEDIYDPRKLRIVVMIYKSDDKEKERIIVKEFPRVFTDSSYSRYVFIPEYYLSEGYQPNINSSISAIMQAIFCEVSDYGLYGLLEIDTTYKIASVFAALLKPDYEIDQRYRSLQPVVDSLVEYLKPDQYVPNNVLSHPVVEVLEEYIMRIIYPEDTNPAPESTASNTTKFLKGNGSWDDVEFDITAIPDNNESDKMDSQS